jgi:hypothetical protein
MIFTATSMPNRTNRPIMQQSEGVHQSPKRYCTSCYFEILDQPKKRFGCAFSRCILNHLDGWLSLLFTRQHLLLLAYKTFVLYAFIMEVSEF